MTEHCKNCGEPIMQDSTPTPQNHWWRTGWHHAGGYEHCNPDPNSNDDRRAVPNNQMRLDT